MDKSIFEFGTITFGNLDKYILQFDVFVCVFELLFVFVFLCIFCGALCELRCLHLETSKLKCSGVGGGKRGKRGAGLSGRADAGSGGGEGWGFEEGMGGGGDPTNTQYMNRHKS